VVENCYFFIPLAFDAPVRGVPKLEWWDYPVVKNFEDMYTGNCLDRILACDSHGNVGI